MRWESELQTAIRAVQQAAIVCRSVQQTIAGDALEKKDKSPVTIADFASQSVVCRLIGDQFPDDPMIGEEDSTELRQADQAPFLNRVVEEVQGLGWNVTADEVCRWIDRGGSREYASRFWTLDPIDGTKGFLRKEQYAIALALIVEGEVVLGVLGCPNLHGTEPGAPAGVLMYATKGGGAFIQPLAGGTAKAVRVSQTANSQQARFCESVESGHSAHGTSAEIARTLGITAEPVRLDSQAKYAVVARGEADIYMRLPTKADYFEQIWDHAAGVLVVQEAGGVVTDVSGKPLEFHHGKQLLKNRGVMVSNGTLHEQLVAAVRGAGVV